MKVIQIAFFLFLLGSCGKRFVVVESKGIGQVRPVLFPDDEDERVKQDPIPTESGSFGQKAPLSRTQQTLFQESNFFKRGARVIGPLQLQKLESCSWQFKEVLESIKTKSEAPVLDAVVKNKGEGAFQVELAAKVAGFFELQFECSSKCSCSSNDVCKSCVEAKKSVAVRIVDVPAKAEEICLSRAEGPCEAFHAVYSIQNKKCVEVKLSGCSIASNCQTQASCQRGLEFFGSF